MNYQRYNRASFLLQAKVLESRLAWVLHREARAKAIETQDKVKAAKKNLADRKRQLDESQAPIKFVLACVSLKPSLALSRKVNHLASDLYLQSLGCNIPACQLKLLQSCQHAETDIHVVKLSLPAVKAKYADVHIGPTISLLYHLAPLNETCPV